MKTPIDLIDDVYSLIPAIVEVFKGNVPDGYKGECIVINAPGITGAQLQRNITNVNIHVPNLRLTISGQPDNSTPDYPRLNELVKQVLPYIEDAVINDTVTQVENILTIPEETKTIINIRLLTNSVNYN